MASEKKLDHEEPSKQSTKFCRYCGSESMVHYVSTNSKQCSVCLETIAWPLSEGQKKLL